MALDEKEDQHHCNTERREDWHKMRLSQDRKALNGSGLYSKINGKPLNVLKWGGDMVPAGFLRGNQPEDLGILEPFGPTNLFPPNEAWKS